MRWWIIVIGIMAMFVSSCGKTPGGGSNIGGKGGTNTLQVTPEHHGEFVDTCTIYIKYNTQDAPANGVYDDSAVCVLVDTTPVATFSGLTKGNYYIFGRGYHSTYIPPNVKGGLPVTIANDGTLKEYLPTYSY